MKKLNLAFNFYEKTPKVMPIKIPTNIHNDLFITTLKIQAAVTEFIEKFLPEEDVQELNLSTLKIEDSNYIDSDMESFEADLVYSCRTKEGKNINIAFVFEHKSFMPSVPHVQPLVYMSTGWYESLKQKVKKGKEETEKTKKKKLPITIPVFLYHGIQKWKTEPFEDYFDIPKPYFKKYIPNYEYIVIDLSKYSDEEIKSLKTGYLVTAFLMLKHHHDPTYLRLNVTEIISPIIEYQNDTSNLNFIRSVWIYYIKVSNFKDEEEFIKLTHKIPNTMQQEAMTGWELAQKIGAERNEEKMQREFAKKIILRFPTWKNAEVASFVDVPISLVKQLKKELKEK